jgi:hypothetical protein
MSYLFLTYVVSPYKNVWLVSLYRNIIIRQIDIYTLNGKGAGSYAHQNLFNRR